MQSPPGGKDTPPFRSIGIYANIRRTWRLHWAPTELASVGPLILHYPDFRPRIAPADLASAVRMIGHPAAVCSAQSFAPPTQGRRGPSATSQFVVHNHSLRRHEVGGGHLACQSNRCQADQNAKTVWEISLGFLAAHPGPLPARGERESYQRATATCVDTNASEGGERDGVMGGIVTASCHWNRVQSLDRHNLQDRTAGGRGFRAN